MRIFITVILVFMWIVFACFSMFDCGHLQNQIEKFLRIESSACTVFGKLPGDSRPKFFVGSGSDSKEYYCNEED
jgi:hypothetical protein